ncbi:MAG: YHS domain-containing protein, partial [Deltaproteobacteria bacterium]
MNRRFALAFPWFLLALVVGIIVFDQSRVRDVIELPANAAVSPAGDVPVGSVRDLVCGMNVRPRTAYPLRIGSRTFYFCSTRCRDRFLEDPARWMRAPQARRGGHTMQGLPTWMYQASVAIVLLLSFGIFEFVSWRAGKRAPVVPAIAARKPLTAHPGVRRLLRRPGFQTSARLMMVAIFLFIIYAGLFGNQNPTMNIAPLLTWTIWWAGLIFLILYFGKAWCYVCPWDALATWLERLSLKSPRRSGLGLRLPWPRRMRNIWFAVILFVLLTWVELGMGITSIPRATAWVALIILGLAIVSALVFDRKSFCRYGCLVGRVSGLYALFSSLELRAEDEAVCRSCKTHDCFKGNDRGDGCPTFEFPRVMKESTYCILCTECLKTCPHDNIAIRARPWGADLAAMGKPRTDEAFLAIILLSMTGFHGLTMTPAWHAWNEALQRTLGIAPGLSFGLLMLGMLLLPIAFFALIARISARWS